MNSLGRKAVNVWLDNFAVHLASLTHLQPSILYDACVDKLDTVTVTGCQVMRVAQQFDGMLNDHASIARPHSKILGSGNAKQPAIKYSWSSCLLMCLSVAGWIISMLICPSSEGIVPVYCRTHAL